VLRPQSKADRHPVQPQPDKAVREEVLTALFVFFREKGKKSLQAVPQNSAVVAGNSIYAHTCYLIHLLLRAFSRILGSHGGEYEDDRLLGCWTV
jgi:hypothetical protein